MGEFEFEIELLISLVEARPVLWNKTVDIYKDRNETKKAGRELCIYLQENFETLVDVKKRFWWVLPYFIEQSWLKFIQTCVFFILCTLLFTFLTSARNELQRLLENSYFIPCIVRCYLPTYWLSIRHISHYQRVFELMTISLANKIVQNNTGLNNDDCKFRTDIKRLLENSPFIAQNFKSTFRIPSCSAQERFAHLFFYFLTRRLEPPNVEVYFCLGQIPHLLQRSMVHLDLLFLKEVSRWVIPAYLSELMPIA